MAIILPLVKPFFRKNSKLILTIICIVLCEGLEVFSSLINLLEPLYRILAIRYFFLIYLGWLWVKDGIVINLRTILLSVISMACIVYFEYFYQPTEPFFFDTSWRCHRWPCYFYVSTLLCGILYYLYDNTKQYDVVVKATKLLAKCSYEIFLLQMIAVPYMPHFEFIQSSIVEFAVRTIAIWIFSIVGGYYFHVAYGKILKTFTK